MQPCSTTGLAAAKYWLKPTMEGQCRQDTACIMQWARPGGAVTFVQEQTSGRRHEQELAVTGRGMWAMMSMQARVSHGCPSMHATSINFHNSMHWLESIPIAASVQHTRTLTMTA